ncbi:MAG: hypothetical protein Q8S13_10385, partial [Dehalococcoidia bacterium]|nr:hypothetical protein [Dehalococcoidia bacterium]
MAPHTSSSTALRRSVERADVDEGVARGGYERDVSESNALLTRNADQADATWAEIHALESRLQRLAQERRDEIDRRVKVVEREERRHVDMSHFRKFAEEHGVLLAAAARTAEAEELLCDMMDEIVRGCAALAQRRVHADRGRLGDARSGTLGEHLAHFREQYLHLGELLYKKERALEELDQRSVYAQAQQELAMDSFNPRAKEYALMKVDIDDERERVKREIAELQRK